MGAVNRTGDPNLPPKLVRHLEQACDRFEAGWQAGRRPRLEDLLGPMPDPGRPALLRELLVLELAYRRCAGERPDREEYRARFPAYAAAVAAAFGEATPAGPPAGDRPRPAGPGPGAGADRNLLFGILALQMDFVARDQLVAAMHAWVLDKARPLGRILVEQGALAEARHDLLAALVREHLKQHGGEPERSLAALSSLGPIRRDLDAIADPDVQASLPYVAAACGPDDPEATRIHPGGSGASACARFRILRPHARGNLGEVHVAYDAELHREVALKEIQAYHADDPQSRARFLLEAEVTGGLEHPGIIPVYSLGHYDGGRPYYAMRFVKGDSLKEAIKHFHEVDQGPRRDPGERALALRGLLGRFVDVCNAVAYAHSRGVLHRDLKPGNVLLGPFGETLVVDWGLAKVVGRPEAPTPGDTATLRPPSAGGSERTLPGSTVGTPAYMSPEQAEGRLDRLGPASDVYSLGATLYHLLTGRAPFSGRDVAEVLERVCRGDFPPPRRVGRAVPAALEAICLRAMAPSPEGRYGSPRELARDLERCLADEPVSAHREGLGPRLARWARRHRASAQAGAAALLAVSLISVAAALLVDGARRNERSERQRADALDEARRRRLAAVRAEVQDLVLKGQAAVSGSDWRDAKLRLSNGLAKIGPEPELGDLRAHAVGLLAEVERQVADQEGRQRARARYRAFLERRDEALYHGTMLHDAALPASREATRDTCQRALALFGVDADSDGAPVLPDRDFDAPQKGEILVGCYELLLALAEAEAPLRPDPAPDAGRIRRAIRILDRAAKLGLTTRAYHLRRAGYLDQLGDERGSREERERAAALPPAGAIDSFLMGEEQYKRGHPERAILDFEATLRMQPDHFWAQYFLAVCYLSLQRPAEGKAYLTACLGRRPDLIWVYLLRGFAHGEAGSLEAAEADIQKAQGLDPSGYARYSLAVNRGVLRIRQGRLEEAVAELERAIAWMPDQYQAYVNLATAYQHQAKWDAALKQIDRAIELEPTLGPLYRSRARLNLERRDAEAALRDFEHASDGEPAGSPARARDHYERGCILYRLGRHEEVIAACDAALGLRPDEAVAHLLRAKALLKLGRWEEAIRACDRYPPRGEAAADAYRTRGQAREGLGDFAGAADDYTRALGIEPDAKVHVNRGWAYVFCDAWRLALHDFEAASRLDPGDGNAYAGRGYARARLGRAREGVEDAEEALRHHRLTPAILFNIACTFALAAGQAEADADRPDGRAAAMRHRARAEEVLRRALDALPPGERPRFWRETVQRDPDLEPIRRGPGFAELEAVYSRPTE